MDNFELFNEEVTDYFKKRGWKFQTLFYDNLNQTRIKTFDPIILLIVDALAINTRKANTNWHNTTNTTEFHNYVKHFLFHIKPFWLKHNITINKIYLAHCSYELRYLNINDDFTFYLTDK